MFDLPARIIAYLADQITGYCGSGNMATRVMMSSAAELPCVFSFWSMSSGLSAVHPCLDEGSDHHGMQGKQRGLVAQSMVHKNEG